MKKAVVLIDKTKVVDYSGGDVWVLKPNPETGENEYFEEEVLLFMREVVNHTFRANKIGDFKLTLKRKHHGDEMSFRVVVTK